MRLHHGGVLLKHLGSMANKQPESWRCHPACILLYKICILTRSVDSNVQFFVKLGSLCSVFGSEDSLLR